MLLTVRAAASITYFHRASLFMARIVFRFVAAVIALQQFDFSPGRNTMADGDSLGS